MEFISNINMKKMFRYAVLLVVGLSIMVYGMIDITLSRYQPAPMTDEEVIKRAKDLGMISVKEAWIEENMKKQNKDETVD